MSEPKGQIAVQQLGLGGILKQCRLLVPPNQREYSWTEKEVTTLFQDIAKAISDGEREYFLGTIVTIPRSADLLEVVDGQQRLATTAILLSEIRNYLIDKEALIAESITNGFLTEIDREKRERIAKMQLNVDDNEFFRSMITQGESRREPKRTSHFLLRDAFIKAQDQIEAIVAGFDPKDHGDVLNKWIGFIEHSAVVVLLRVPSDINAYKIFETLNDRGLKISQADLVKNYLFGQADNRRLAEAQQKWAMMRAVLETLDEEDATVTFLRHALISIRGFLREPQVYEAVQVQAKGSQAALTFLATAETLAQLYVALLNPEHEQWNSYPDAIRRAIKTLNLINIRPLRPIMLAVTARLAPQDATEAFQYFITCGVRLMIAASTRSGSVESALATAANLIYLRDIKTPGDLKRNLSAIIPNDEQFRQSFEVASVSKASLARYYLRSLEMAAKRDQFPWFIPNDDRETINLEHVLPERPETSWPQFSEEAVRAYVRRIGNLALLTAKGNSDLKSSNFEKKKDIYKQAPYQLTQELGQFDSWTEAKIIERQKRMAALAVQAWPL